DPVAAACRVKRELRAGEGYWSAYRNRPVAARDVCVLDAELRDHLRNDVIQIGAMVDLSDERLVLVVQRLPVVPVHVPGVEVVAIATPDFFEDLVPLVAWDSVDHESIGRHSLSSWRSVGLHVVDGPTARLHEQFLQIAGDGEGAGVLENCGGLAVLER